MPNLLLSQFNELEAAKALIQKLQQELQQVKDSKQQLIMTTEQEEEAISNKLLKRISELKLEKQALQARVEEEEFLISHTLQSKLTKLQKDKIEMEMALEQEQEFIVNKLTKQLDSARGKSGGSSPNLISHSRTGSISELNSQSSLDLVKIENINLKRRVDLLERDIEDICKSNLETFNRMKHELVEAGIFTEDRFEKEFEIRKFVRRSSMSPSFANLTSL